MTIPEIAAVAENAGFSGDDLTTAVAIALAESSGNPNAHGDLKIGSGSGSYGLWQIYSDAHPEYGPDFTVLYDPQTNADAAFAIYSKAGNTFTDWTTFNTGTYQAFMQSVAANVAAAVTENPGTSIGVLIAAAVLLLFFFKRA